MPRKSAEDRAAAYWRAGGKPPPPPDILSTSAKALWRKIVGSKPYDYFEPAAQELLAQYCELCITQRLNFEQLRRDPLNPEWQQLSARLQAPINSLAVKLRLSPSAVLSKKHGILDEKEVDTTTSADSSVLLFGGPGQPRF
jgi:hypothetical protein